MSDIVEEARALLKQHSRIHAMHASDPAKDVDVAGMIEALADEVQRLRNICDIATVKNRETEGLTSHAKP